MASRFATVSKDEIFEVNEAGTPTNTKKETILGLSANTQLTSDANDFVNPKSHACKSGEAPARGLVQK